MLVHNLVVTGSLTFPTALPISGSLLVSGSVGINTTVPAYNLDVSGSGRFSSNVGIGGATISSMSAVSGIELVQGSQIASRVLANVPQLYISSNIAGDSYAPTYKVNGYAAQYRLQGYDGTHVFYTAPSGTAGNNVNFTASLTIAPTSAATFSGNNSTNTTENASVSWNDSNANLMGKIVGYRGANGNDGNLRFYTRYCEKYI